MKRIVLLLLLPLLLSAAEARTWKSRAGKELDAEYVRHAYGIVTLKNAAGQVFRIQMAQLSADDQAYIKSLAPKSTTSKTTPKSSTAKIKPGDPEVVAQMLPGKTIKREAAGQTGMTYHVYVPTSFKAKAPPPMIIAFSPGGGGGGMVNAMKASAEKVGWMVVGCDKLRNGMKDGKLEEKMEDEVLDDIYSKVPNDPQRIYLAGFSGGAMRAYGISARREEKIAGIIAYGGWLGGADHVKAPYCKYMAVAMVNGNGDKGANSWVQKDTKTLRRRKCHVKQFSYPGGHGIAPPEITDKCIAWLQEDWKESGSTQR
jgi:predicted esterase